MSRYCSTFTGFVMAVSGPAILAVEPASGDVPFWPSVWPSLVANCLFALALVFLFWCALGLGRRAELLEFFTNQNAPDTKVTLFQSVLSTGSKEAFISHDETRFSQRLASLFNNPVPILSEDNWLRDKIQIAGSTCQLTHMRDCQDAAVFSGNCVVVGSPAFNPVAEAFERFLHPPVEFEMASPVSGHMELRAVVKGQQTVKVLDQSAVIVRIHNGVAVCIYVAGPTATSTAGALHFLTTHWRKLSGWKKQHAEFWCEIQVPEGRPELAVVVGGPHPITSTLRNEMEQLDAQSPRPPDYWSRCRQAEFAAYLREHETMPTGTPGVIPRAGYPMLEASAAFSGGRDDTTRASQKSGNEICGSNPPR